MRHSERLYTAKPGERDKSVWTVWDMYHPDAAPVFIGTMEEAGLVADALNEPFVRSLLRPPETQPNR